MEGINPLKKNSLALEGAIKKAFAEAKIENFSNGRFVRNLYEDLIMNQAVRLDKILHPTSEELTLLTSDDFKQL